MLVFALCFTLVYAWSTLMFFNFLPGWILYLGAWSIVGIFAYSQIFALLESLVCLFVMLLLAFVLPSRLLRQRFAAKAAVLILLAAAMAITAHMTGVIPLWPSKKLIAVIIFYLFVSGAAVYLLDRYERLEQMVESGLERLRVLMFLYLPFVAAGVIILAVRNLAGVL